MLPYTKHVPLTYWAASRMTELRTYIAGIGSSGALIAAVVVAFFALGGIVAINGLPESSTTASGGSVLVETGPSADVTVAKAAADTRAQRGEIEGRSGRDSTGGSQGVRGKEGGSPRPGGGTPQPVDPAPAPTDSPLPP